MEVLLDNRVAEKRLVTDELNRRFENSGTRKLIAAILAENPGKRIATVSSFGSNSVVLLHLMSSIDPDLPIIFVDTGKLFPATLRYRDELATRLGLTNIMVARPNEMELTSADPVGSLWMRDREACCNTRKVAPFQDALDGVDIWFSGRKRYQGGLRQNLPLFEADGKRLKINPLANWTSADIEIYRNAFGLPQHPLVASGYRSIGCEPCTTPVGEGEDERAGRWRGLEKTECGIHGIFENGGGI